MSNFIVQALKENDITIYGDGSQPRFFCHVHDVIDGLVKMMERPEGFTGPVNMGDPAEFTIFELAQPVIRLTEPPPTRSRGVLCSSAEADWGLRPAPRATCISRYLFGTTALDDGTSPIPSGTTPYCGPKTACGHYYATLK
jgi:nucleoside-diphosphate-sugar epimerase